MRISMIPWESIWAASILVLIVSLIWTVVAQIRRRKFGLPTAPLLYLSLLLVIAIPPGVKLTGYRFDLAASQAETTKEDHELPDLRTHRYQQVLIEDMYDASLRAVQSSRTYGQPWRIRYAGVDGYDSARIDVLVPVLFFFTSEMSITIIPLPAIPGAKDVIVFNSAPSIPYNLGENARQIVRFYHALDAELAKQP